MRIWLTFILAIGIIFSSNVSIAKAATFQDLGSVPWAQNAIGYLSGKDIVHGYNASRFAPEEKMTRAQATLLLVNALHPGESATTNPGFTDVPKSNFYHDAIALAAEKGLINGYSDGTFRPNAPVTRAEASVLIDKGLNVERMPLGVAYSDVTPVAWAKESVLDLSSHGIINGYPDGLFKPANSISRAEFAVILGSALNPDLIAIDTYDDEFKNHDLQEFEKKVVELTNKERAAHGLKPLKIDVELSRLAWYKSRDMAVNGYFEHKSPTYGSPFEMMTSFGFYFYSAAENIAAGQTSPEQVVQDWMNSKGHRDSILTPEYTHIGIGYVKGGADGTYWTQMFIEK